jgi:hypothetical protein
VTVTIGASGDCEITAGAFADISAAGGAFSYLPIDGGTPESTFGIDCAAGIEANVQTTRRLSTLLSGTLTPGAHTFTMQYEASGGVTAQFGANYLKVQPL